MLTLTVSDSLRLDLTRVGAVSLLSVSQLPHEAGSPLYYVLEGSLCDVFVRMSSAQCYAFREEPATGLLVSSLHASICEIERCFYAVVDVSWPEQVPVSVPAGNFSDYRLIGARVADLSVEGGDYSFAYADSVGIVQLGWLDRPYGLANAQVDGRRYPQPSHVRPFTWGMFKASGDQILLARRSIYADLLLP